MTDSNYISRYIDAGVDMRFWIYKQLNWYWCRDRLSIYINSCTNTNSNADSKYIGWFSRIQGGLPLVWSIPIMSTNDVLGW